MKIRPRLTSIHYQHCITVFFDNILLSINKINITNRSDTNTGWQFLTLQKVDILYTDLFTDCCRQARFLDLFIREVYS